MEGGKGGIETKLMNSWLWSRLKAVIREIYELLLVEQTKSNYLP